MTWCHPSHHQRSVHMKVWKALHVHRSTRSKRCANPPQTDGQQSDACSTECLARPLERSLAVPHPHCTSCGSQQEIHCHWLVVLPGIGCCRVCLTVSHDPSLLAPRSCRDIGWQRGKVQRFCVWKRTLLNRDRLIPREPPSQL